jgi:hypothetical protein
MKKVLFIGLIIGLFVINSFGQIKTHLTNQQSLNYVLDGYLKQASSFGFSGVVVVAVDGKLEFQRAYGLAGMRTFRLM